MSQSENVSYLSRVFQISTRRGMIPWRRDEECIAEPYHPDRVARQFRLDQVVPFPPFVSLYTRNDIGIAYAFWLHLLRDAEDPRPIPDDSRVGDSSVAWANWLNEFMKPFADVFDQLRNGNMTGKVPYDERRKRKSTLQCHIRVRPLSDEDFRVLKRVADEHQDQHIGVIEQEEARVKDHWMPILHEATYKTLLLLNP